MEGEIWREGESRKDEQKVKGSKEKERTKLSDRENAIQARGDTKKRRKERERTEGKAKRRKREKNMEDADSNEQKRVTE